MERCYGTLKSLWARVAHFAAAFAMSATLLLAVVSAFYSVSSELLLADSARSGVATCDTHSDGPLACMSRPAAKAQAQDAGASRVATLAARRRGTAR